jgi:hypothetical protein
MALRTAGEIVDRAASIRSNLFESALWSAAFAEGVQAETPAIVQRLDRADEYYYTRLTTTGHG